jgi:hypothetical protein
MEVSDVQDYLWGRFVFFFRIRTATAGRCKRYPLENETTKHRFNPYRARLDSSTPLTGVRRKTGC